MKNLPKLILLFVLITALASCSKQREENLSEIRDLNQAKKQVNELLKKYNFSLDTTSIKRTDGEIILKISSVKELEDTLKSMNRIRRTPEQADSVKKAFLDDFKKKYTKISNSKDALSNSANSLSSYNGTHITLNSINVNNPVNWVRANACAKYLINAGGGGDDRIIPCMGAIVNWNVSGIIPGVATETTADRNIYIIGYGMQAVACQRTWTWKVTIQYSGAGFSFPIGYVLRGVGFFNVGSSIHNFVGDLTVT